MTRITRLSASMLLALLTASTAATPPPQPVAAGIQVPERFATADFTQERRIAALDRPLRSSGSVSLSEDGFVWSQEEPYQVSLRFDGETIEETSVAGGQPVTRTVRDPITNQLTTTLFRMMSGSWQQMQASFAINPLPAPDQGRWALELRPRDEAVKKFIPRIVLDGSRYVDTIVVEEARGNSTRIELHNQRPPE